MIRRLPAALASVALAATIASGCSTFTKNNNAATVSGRHLSITEFESLSEFREGDDPRRIDWRATARYRRPIVRRFQVERQKRIR